MTARPATWLVAVLLTVTPAVRAAPVPATDPAAAFKPTITVRFQPLDQLLGDANYVAGLIARFAPTEQQAKEFVGALDAALDKLLGPDWRKAVDTTRPFLGYATVDANLPASRGAILIPVKDQDAFRKVLAGLVGKVEDDASGVLRFALPGTPAPAGAAMNGYVRFAHQYAYITVIDPSVVALNRLPTPAQIAASDATAGVSVRMFVDRLPESFRQMAVGGVQQFKAMLHGGSPLGGGVFGIGAAEMLILAVPLCQLYPLAEPVVRDGQEVVLNLSFDRKRLNLGYELIVTPKTGSELSRLVGTIRPTTSLFPQMFGADTAGRAVVRATIPDDWRQVFFPKLEVALKQLPAEVPTWGVAAAKIAEQLLPTLREGEIDLAIGLRGPHPRDGYGLFAGLRLKDAAAVERAFRIAAKQLPKDMQEMVQLDVAAIGATKVHQIRLPALPDTVKTIFGDTGIHVAFRPDAVLLGFGSGLMLSLHDGLAATPKPSAQFLIDVSGRKLVPLVSKIDADTGKKFKMFLGNDIDRVPLLEMAIEGGSALTARYGNGLAGAMPLIFFARSAAVPAARPVAVPVPVRPAPPVVAPR